MSPVKSRLAAGRSATVLSCVETVVGLMKSDFDYRGIGA